MLLKAETNELLISWTDKFPSEQGYKIERLATTGQWEGLESLPAAADTGTEYRWERVIDSAGTYRVLSLQEGYSVPLEVEPGRSEVAVDSSTDGMSLKIDQSEPLTGAVRLTLESASAARSVRYFADTGLIATSVNAPSFPVTWDSQRVADGSHLLQAHVERAPGSIIELRRVVITDNPNVAVSLAVIGTSGIVRLSALASSDAGIHSVEFFVDGSSLAVLTAPDSAGRWIYSLDTRSLPAGPAVIRVVVTDNASERAEAQTQIVIDNPPTVTLDTPVDGAIVTGRLQVRGTFGDDQPGAVLTISIGDVQILQTSTSPFSADYSLAGLPGGTYTLTVQARDSAGKQHVARREIVLSSTHLEYELVDSLAEGTSILDTENGVLLYQKNGLFVIRKSDGSEAVLQVPSTLSFANGWQLREGRTAMYALSSDPLLGGYHIYLFDEAGQARIVSREISPTSDTNIHPVLKGPWIAWHSGSAEGAHSIYNVDTREFHRVVKPQGTGYLGNWNYDLTISPGDEQLIFWAQTGGEGTGSEFDIYRYRLATRTTEVITGGSFKQIYPQTDGARIAWQKSPRDQLHPPYELMAASITNPTSAATLSTTMSGFQLRDGLLAWIELASSVPALKVSDGQTTVTLSSSMSTQLYSVADGHVIFGENGKLHVWSMAVGKRMLLDALPRTVVHGDGIAFIATGMSDISIHRVRLP